MKTINDKGANWRDEDGRLHLMRCYKCEPKRGRENRATYRYSGQCAWCGWTEADEEKGGGV